ncbi:MAG: serine/threonine protein kinase [Sphingobacteriales bacterium]|nr:MAG: serine/threonine protein kinase [Sphingobacteriales bacterium]
MALPLDYMESGFEENFSLYVDLIQRSKSDLVEIVESKVLTFSQRIAAGQILALTGDPRINLLSPTLIEIPASEVRLGLEESDLEDITQLYLNDGVMNEWIRKECPSYSTSLKKFRIAKYCVTNMEYLAFLKDSSWGRYPSSWIFGCYFPHLANHPVYTIDPIDAEAYVAWLSRKTGRNFRLPTEAEWEYAAGGSMRFEFPWGNEYLKDHANTVEAGLLTSTPVGCFPKGASPFGLLDMAGNVEEYVQDDYMPYPGGETISDDLAATYETPYRVARGGSFTRFRDLARCKRRHGKYSSSLYIMGFRLVEDLGS